MQSTILNYVGECETIKQVQHQLTTNTVVPSMLCKNLEITDCVFKQNDGWLECLMFSCCYLETCFIQGHCMLSV